MNSQKLAKYPCFKDGNRHQPCSPSFSSYIVAFVTPLFTWNESQFVLVWLRDGSNAVLLLKQFHVTHTLSHNTSENRDCTECNSHNFGSKRRNTLEFPNHVRCNSIWFTRSLPHQCGLQQSKFWFKICGIRSYSLYTIDRSKILLAGHNEVGKTNVSWLYFYRSKRYKELQ